MYSWGRFEHGELGLGRDLGPKVSTMEAAKKAGDKTASTDAVSEMGSSSTEQKEQENNGTPIAVGTVETPSQDSQKHGSFPPGVVIPTPTLVRSSIDSTKVAQLCCGNFHTAVVGLDGALFTWGGDGAGQLGHGGISDVWTPTRVSALADKTVSNVACGRSHSLAVVDDRVYSWGKARHGQLGFGGKNWDQMNPRQIPALHNIKVAEVACGECHSLALAASGDVYAWGRGKSGRLGLKTETAQMYPKLVTRLSGKRAVRIRAGFYHSMALLKSGTLCVWGANNYSQLGLGTNRDEFEPVAVRIPTPGSSSATDAYSAGAGMGMAAVAPTEDLERVVDIAAGAYHSLALTSSGLVFAWGLNRYGQLGTGDEHDRILPYEVDVFSMLSSRSTRAFKLAAGLFHSAVLTVAGKLYTFGDGCYGQLGQGSLEQSSHPTGVNIPDVDSFSDVACASYHTVALAGPVDLTRQVELDPEWKDDTSGLLPSVQSSVGGSQDGGIFSLFALCGGARPGGKPPKTGGGLGAS